MSVQFERRVEVTPAYDRRNAGCGVGSCTLRFLLMGPRGTTQFVMLTGWYLPGVEYDFRQQDYRPEAIGMDVGYHSPTPMYEGQASMPCDVLPGGRCYYDGSSIAAHGVMRQLIEEGHEAVWRRLEADYMARFGDDNERR